MRLAIILLLLSGCIQGIGTGDDSVPGAATSSGSGAGAPGGDTTVPANAQDLLAFLAAGRYAAFPHDPEARPPQGPHGIGGVVAYYQPKLYASLQNGAPAHPVGAAAVMELLQGDKSSRLGWVVAVKTQPDSDGGFGWYWLEAVDQGGPRLVDEGQGLGLCTGCHASGDDYVL